MLLAGSFGAMLPSWIGAGSIDDDLILIYFIISGLISCIVLILFVFTWSLIGSMMCLTLFFMSWQFINSIFYARLALALKKESLSLSSISNMTNTTGVINGSRTEQPSSLTISSSTLSIRENSKESVTADDNDNDANANKFPDDALGSSSHPLFYDQGK